LALFYHTRIRGESSPFFRGVIKPFSEDYIDDAAKLFAAYYESHRSLQPLLPERDILRQVPAALSRIASNPGVAAFRKRTLVGYMIETCTAESFMSKRTAFCIDLCAHCAVEEEKELIYQEMYEQLSRIWVGNRYHTHEISYLTSDKVLSFAFYRLGFGMTHFELLRTLEPIDGGNADVLIRKLESEEPIKELNREHHAYYPNPPLFWIPHDEYDEDKDGILSGDIEVFAAFDRDKPVAFFSVKRESAESWLLNDERNLRIMGAFAKEEYRHRGIGQALLREVIDWAIQNDCDRLYVEGESANIYGGNFWMKHFTPVVFSVRRCVDERVTVKEDKATNKESKQ
jgi:GNAT superfamily N-acetyltransferase